MPVHVNNYFDPICIILFLVGHPTANRPTDEQTDRHTDS